jgi:spore coat protein U-like protein
MMGLQKFSRLRLHRAPAGALLIVAAGLAQNALGASNVSCTVTPTTLAFGSYNTTADLSMPMTMAVTCGGWGSQTSSVSYVLTASAGSGSYSGRQMLNGANVITYNLYTTSGETTIWGDGTGGTVTLTGTVTKQNPTVNVTIYGLIRGGQNVIPGSYSTTTAVNVTLTYTF